MAFFLLCLGIHICLPQVMSADAFGAFQEVGLENRSELARVGRK